MGGEVLSCSTENLIISKFLLCFFFVKGIFGEFVLCLGTWFVLSVFCKRIVEVVGLGSFLEGKRKQVDHEEDKEN